MVRRRWAVAVVALASVLLLHLFVPKGAPEQSAAAGTAVAENASAVSPGGWSGPSGTEAEGAGDACPGEEGASVRGLAARSPRTGKAAGAVHLPAGSPEGLPIARCGSRADLASPSAAGSSGALCSGRGAPAALQAFRC
ncbi:hypothetical protein GCM10027072_61900 [Streptomyces bullii]